MLSFGSVDAVRSFTPTGKSVADYIRSMSSRAIDGMFREVALPVYLLPNGSRPDDFTFWFDFTETIQQMKSFKLVRPVLAVWIGREDFDRERFEDDLKGEFVRQFEDARGQIVDEVRTKYEQLERERQSAKGKAVGPLALNTGVVAALVILSATGVGAVILLSFALFAGQQAIGPLLDYLRITLKTRGRKKKMRRRLGDLDSRFTRGTKASAPR